MKWTFIIREKLKVALLLASIMFLIVFTNIMERRNIQNMDRSFTSIYYDRLIPATDIFYLTGNLYDRRLIMETFLFNEGSPSVADVRKKLELHSLAVDDLIAKFEKTFLVKEESKSLAELKRGIDHYGSVERKILEIFAPDSKPKAQLLYEEKGKTELIRIFQHLEELTKIQSQVGLALIHDSKGIISSSDLMLTVQIATALVIGLLIQALIIASRVVNTKNQDFTLN
jgi:hypothetical protein